MSSKTNVANMVKVTTDELHQVFAKWKQRADGYIEELDIRRYDYEHTVETIKRIIDWEMDWANSFTLEFNDSYTRIRKRVNEKVKRVYTNKKL